MNRLKELRKSKKVSQKVVADLLGFTRVAYTNIENGKRETNFESLKKLADYFDVSIDYLLGVTDDLTFGNKKSPPFSDEQKKIMEISKELEEDELEKLIEYVEFLKSKRNK